MSLFNRSLYISIFALLILAQSFSPISSSSQAMTVAADSKLLEPATLCDDALWASGFGLPGVNDDVKAVAASGNDLYVVGNFSNAGNTKARRIAKWDGARWTSPGGGLPLGFGDIEAVAVTGNNIYVAGSVGSTDPAMSSGVMRWDGASWSFLPRNATNGLSNRVRTMAVIGNDLYVAGTLYISDGENMIPQPILKWDGSNWSKVGDNLAGSVNAMAVSGNNIYIGGSLSIGGASANNVAKWDGSNWSALGGGVSGDNFEGVSAIAASGNDVYVGGELTSAGGVSVNYVAKWDGSNWSALGTGANNGVSSSIVNALGVIGNDVYVGGVFSRAGGLSSSSGAVPVHSIAKWNGSSWSALGTGDNNGISRGNFTAVNAIAVSGENVFIAGDFTRAAGGENAYNVIKWNNGFSELGGEILNGLNGEVYATAVMGNDVYVGGNFTTAGGITVNHVARWDGYRWWPLGTGSTKGVDGAVNALTVSENNLYVGGGFNRAGGDLAIGVAKWDGSNWSAFNNGSGFGVNGGVNAIAVVGSDVYVGGFFTLASGVAVNNIARWNGSNWSPLGSGIAASFGQGNVHEIKARGTDVYVGGSFSKAGPITARGIARWDGANWHAIGDGLTSSGLSGSVNAMAFSGNNLYVGGSFDTAGSVTANNVAMWDGDNWSALIVGTYNGFNDVIFAVDADDSGVYVGGYPVFAGELTVAGIAKWDGETWTAFGSGTGGGFSGTVRSIVVKGANMYVGGNFSTAGGKPSYGFAVWGGSTLLSAVSQSFNMSGGGGHVAVNMPGGCSWNATSNNDWIILTSPASNSGSNTVTYEVRENFNAQSRSGTMTIAGQTFTVRQAGLAIQVCATSISPRFDSFSSAGGTSVISVATSDGCLWSATSKANWITIISESNRIGSGSLSYRVAANTTGSPRAGKITINGQSFSVKQK